jgi:hypothetical protein
MQWESLRFHMCSSVLHNEVVSSSEVGSGSRWFPRIDLEGLLSLLSVQYHYTCHYYSININLSAVS